MQPIPAKHNPRSSGPRCHLLVLGFLPLVVLIFSLALPGVSQTTRPGFTRTSEQEVVFNSALLHFYANDLTTAAQDFRNVILSNPGDPEAYYYLGLCFLGQDRPSDAVAMLNESLRFDPTIDDVRAARATALVRLRQFDAAKTDLAALGDPQWKGLRDYLEGQMLYQHGEFRAAAEKFDAARKETGINPVAAGFYAGLSYFQLRDLSRGRTVILETPGIDRDAASSAALQQLDAVLAAEQRRSRPWEVQLELAYEYDTNVVLLGSSVQLPSNISRRDDNRFLVAPRGSYSFIRTDRLEAGLETTNYFAFQDNLQNFNIASYQAGPYLNFKLAPNLFASVRYDFNYLTLGYHSFLKRNLVTPQLTLQEPKFGFTSVFYQFEDRQFLQPEVTQPLKRDGDLNVVGVLQGITLPELFKGSGAAELDLSYRFSNQQTRGSDFSGNFNTAGATLVTPLPFWKLKGDIGVNATFENYEHPNSLDAIGRRRDDFEVNTLVGLTKELFRGVTLRVDYSYTDHQSNVRTNTGSKPYQFDRNVLGVRLILSY